MTQRRLGTSEYCRKLSSYREEKPSPRFRLCPRSASAGADLVYHTWPVAFQSRTYRGNMDD